MLFSVYVKERFFWGGIVYFFRLVYNCESPAIEKNRKKSTISTKENFAYFIIWRLRKLCHLSVSPLLPSIWLR